MCNYCLDELKMEIKDDRGKVFGYVLEHSDKYARDSQRYGNVNEFNP